jgi:sarcosine oxidase/L-pipecolate oxidase
MGKEPRRVIIVGSGCFGLSTALHLLQHPSERYLVTLVDRATEIPAPDAASTDLNKVIRSSYSDIFYAKLAREAIDRWKHDEMWADAYHERVGFDVDIELDLICDLNLGDYLVRRRSGVLVVGGANNNGAPHYVDSAYVNDSALGCRLESVSTMETAANYFSEGVKLGTTISSGYINRDGGWAFASGGIEKAYAKVKDLGADFKLGEMTEKLLFDSSGRTTGVELRSGEILIADTVIISTGSWTASSFVDLEVHQHLKATGSASSMITTHSWFA